MSSKQSGYIYMRLPNYKDRKRERLENISKSHIQAGNGSYLTLLTLS